MTSGRARNGHPALSQATSLRRRQGAREFEALQGSVVEARYGRNLISAQGQHQKADEVQDWGVAVPEVHAEGRLAIGAGGHEPPRDLGWWSDGPKELPSLRSALKLQGQRRHGEPHVLGEDGDNTVEVTGFEGTHEPLHDLAFSAGAGRGRGARGGQSPSSLQRGARPFERACHRFFGRIENRRRLLGTVPKDVSQDQRRALAWRERLE